MIAPSSPAAAAEREEAAPCWVSWKRLPFCWRCTVVRGAKQQPPAGRPRIACAQRRACSAEAVCCWCGLLLLLAFLLFVLTAYWTCITLPVHRLHRLHDAVSDGADNNKIEKTNVVVARVLSLNMFLRTDGITDDATAAENDFKQERLEYFIAHVMENYDILLLQETWSVNDAGRKKRLVSAARDKGFEYFTRSRCAIGGLMDAMLLILSRHPLVSTHEHTFTKAIGVDAYATKGVLHARAWLHGEENCAVDLFATHLQAGGGEEGAVVRSLQTREVAAFVDAQRGSVIPPAVVAGDFNINGRTSDGNGTTGARYAEMMRDLSLKKGGGGALEVVFPRNAIRHSNSETRVLPVTSPVRTEEGGSKLVGQNNTRGTCLDYVFFGAGGGREVQGVLGSGRVNPLFTSSGSPFVTVSDHYAVEFNLTCNRTQTGGVKRRHLV